MAHGKQLQRKIMLSQWLFSSVDKDICLKFSGEVTKDDLREIYLAVATLNRMLAKYQISKTEE